MANMLSCFMKVGTGHPRRGRVFDDGVDPLSRLLIIHLTGQDRLQWCPDDGFPVGQIAKTIKDDSFGLMRCNALAQRHNADGAHGWLSREAEKIGHKASGW